MADRYYTIGYNYAKEGFLFENKNNITKFVFLKNPFGRWNADPFPFIYKGKHYIFAESASIITRKGKIYYICLDDKKPRWKKALAMKYHLSFPNILEKENNIYIIPESHSIKQINCFRAINFPKKWIIDKTLCNSINAVDSAFLDDYLVTYENESGKRLIIFKNAFKNIGIFQTIEDQSEVLRPAGNSFIHLGKNIFPTQLNTNIYGEGVLFREIILESKIVVKDPFLSIDATFLQDILSDKSICGIHTYNKNGDFEVIDIITMKKSFFGLIHNILKKILKR